MKKLLLSLFFIVSCNSQIPSKGVSSYNSPYAIEEEKAVIEAHTEFWIETLGSPAPLLLGLKIYWSEDPIEYGDNKYAAGLTHSKDSIELLISPNCITNTAFTHELTHVRLWRESDDPDAEHKHELFQLDREMRESIQYLCAEE